MRGYVEVISASGNTVKVEIENDITVEQVASLAGLVSSKLALNGEAVAPDTPCEAGDVVEEHRTAEGA